MRSLTVPLCSVGLDTLPKWRSHHVFWYLIIKNHFKTKLWKFSFMLKDGDVFLSVKTGSFTKHYSDWFGCAPEEIRLIKIFVKFSVFVVVTVQWGRDRARYPGEHVMPVLCRHRVSEEHPDVHTGGRARKGREGTASLSIRQRHSHDDVRVISLQLYSNEVVFRSWQ